MQYEIVFKGDKWCSCYTCLPQTAPTARSVPRKVAPSTPPTTQCLLTMQRQNKVQHIHIQANKANAMKQYNNTSKQHIKLR